MRSLVRLAPATTLSLIIGSAIVLACSGEDGSAEITPETACNDASNALCSKINECAPFFFTAIFADVASCATRFKINCASSFTATGTSATPTQVAQCSSDVKSTSCDDVFNRQLPASCRTVPGTLEDGTVCGHNAQCKNKLCRRAKDSTCGACSILGTGNAACQDDDDCDYGLKCHQQKCITYSKSGTACSGAQPCLPSLACVNGTCVAPLAAGAACTFKAGENPCDAVKALYCHPKNNVCAPIGTSAPGGECELSVDKITGCSGAAECKITPPATKGTCQPVASDGAACDDTSGPKCLGPARCTGKICTITDPSKCK